MADIALFDGIAKLIDRLIQLLTIRQARRKEVFEQCLKPLFDDLEEVHSDYLQTFGQALRLVEEDDYFSKIIELVRERRLPMAPVRDKLREFLEEIAYTELAAEEKVFYTATAKYIGVRVPWQSQLTAFAIRMAFLEHKTACGTRLPIDSELQADQYLKLKFEEPTFESYAVFRYLQEVEDPRERSVKQLVSSVINGQMSELNARWIKVVKAYSALQLAIARM